MTATPPIREATDTEKAYFRSAGQFSKLYLAFPQPAIVFQAQVNDSAPATDLVATINYDEYGSYDYNDILPDMTLLVGSTPLGYDLGIARIRKLCSETQLFVGYTSELKLSDGVFLTVIDEYGLWPRNKYIQAGPTHVDYMDYDVAYDDDQHADLDPCPVLGPDRVLLYQGTLGGANTISTVLDGSASYCLGSTIKAYPNGFLWTASAGSFDDATLEKPTWTGDAPGTVRLSCKVTAANNKEFTGRRVIVVFDDTQLPVSDFKLNSCEGSYADGGWNFKVTMYDNAALDQVRDRAQCILFARDWYGDLTSLTDTGISFEASSKKIKKTSGLSVFTKGSTMRVSGSTSNNGDYNVVTSDTAYLVVDKALVDEAAGDTVTIQVMYGQKEISIGPVAGCENIICNGWITKEDLDLNVEGGTAAFTVQGPQYWFKQMTFYLSGLLNSSEDPTEWLFIKDMTVDKGIWDLLHWRATATVMMDCIMSGNELIVPEMSSSTAGGLWEEMLEQAAHILASLCCDRYGRLFLEIPGNLIPIDDRAFTLVMTLEAYDRQGEIILERQTVPPSGQIDMQGIWYDGTTGYGLRSLASGHLVGRYGMMEIVDKVEAADQSDFNELASLILARKTNEFPLMSIKIPENNRLIDVCPVQQLFVVTDTDENPREVEVSNNVFPNRIAYDYDSKSHSISVEVDSETETTIVQNVATGEIPIADVPPDTPMPSFIPWFPTIPLVPPLPPEPQPDLPPADDCGDDAPENGPFFAMWDKGFLNGDPTLSGDENKARIWLKGTIRASTATYQTILSFHIVNDGTAYLYLHVYGIDPSGARVATATVSCAPYSYSWPEGIPDYKQMTVVASFTLPSATTVAGFEVELERGYALVPSNLYNGDYVNGDGTKPDTTSGYGLIVGKSMQPWTECRPPKITRVIYESALGHIQYRITDVDPWPGSGFDVQWRWEPALTGDVGADGATYIKHHAFPAGTLRVKDYTDSYVYPADNELVKIKDSGAPGYAPPLNIYDEINLIVPSTSSIDIWCDIYYGGFLTTFRQVGLGVATVVNMCPA